MGLNRAKMIPLGEGGIGYGEQRVRVMGKVVEKRLKRHHTSFNKPQSIINELPMESNTA